MRRASLACCDASRPRTMVATSPGSTLVAANTSMLERSTVRITNPKRRTMKRPTYPASWSRVNSSRGM